MSSDVNILNILTDEINLNQEDTNYIFYDYREKHEPKIHVSQGSLKEYADIITSIIFMLIRHYVDV